MYVYIYNIFIKILYNICNIIISCRFFILINCSLFPFFGFGFIFFFVSFSLLGFYFVVSLVWQQFKFVAISSVAANIFALVYLRLGKKYSF